MSEKRDLNDLNEMLFDTMEGLKNGSIKTETAKGITEAAKTIVGNAKVQLDALKMLKGQGVITPPVLGMPTTTVITAGSKDKHTQMAEFAVMLGYSGVIDAFDALGKDNFIKRFENEYE